MSMFDVSKQAVKAEAKARKFAEKKGIDISDAVAVGQTYQDGAEQIMVVRHDRVEVHHLGKVGSLFKANAGVTTLEPALIGSVSTRREGIFTYLVIGGSGQDVEFRCFDDGRLLVEAIRNCGKAPAAAQAVPAAAPVPPPPAVPAGWYPQGEVQRYWDGASWTEHTAPLA